jgi:hypothetical protein
LNDNIPAGADAGIDLRGYGTTEAMLFPNKVKVTHCTKAASMRGATALGLGHAYDRKLDRT